MDWRAHLHARFGPTPKIQTATDQEGIRGIQRKTAASGINSRSAGLGEADRPPTTVPRVQLRVEVTSTAIPAFKISYAARTDHEVV
jgi:hypothetical protein